MPPLSSTPTKAQRALAASAVTLVASCSHDAAPAAPAEGPTVAEVVEAYPAAAPLLRAASSSPARRAGSALVVGGTGLRATLDEGGVGPLRLGGRSLSLAVHRPLAGRAPPRVDRGVVVQPDAHLRADALLVARDDGVEELVLAREPASEIVYQLALPPRWRLRADERRGLVEVLDDRRAARLRVWASEAWGRDQKPVAVRVAVAGDRITLRVDEQAAFPVLVDPLFVGTSQPIEARAGHAAARLGDGRVLLAGGRGPTSRHASAEIYDPRSDGFTLAAGELAGGRSDLAASVLDDGRVLLVGGHDDEVIPRAEAAIFDPSEDRIVQIDAHMTSPRASLAATTLPGGEVLLSGGSGGGKTLDSLELFDPATQAFSALPLAMIKPRHMHTSTLLGTGKVLLAGGANGVFSLDAIELFDPSTATLATSATHLVQTRSAHSATLLPDGRVLLAGSLFIGGGKGAEIYDPAADSCASVSDMTTFRANHGASLVGGRVLVTGGGPTGAATDGAELFDPGTGRFEQVSSPMADARSGHTSTTLDDGRVLIVGGERFETGSTQGVPLRSAEVLLGWADLSVMVRGKLLTGRHLHTATPLGDGKVLLIGGYSSDAIHRTAEIFDPATLSSEPSRGLLADGRAEHTAVPVAGGKVLVSGGIARSGNTQFWSLFDVATQTFSPPSYMASGRYKHAATRLADGRVLLTGGGNGLSTEGLDGEIFDPSDESSKQTGYLVNPRGEHTATLLSTGRVLLVGGTNDPFPTAAEEYDPVTDGYAPLAGSMSALRRAHTATLLAGDRVLLVGGLSTGGAPKVCEIYDRAKQAFSPTKGPMSVGRFMHTATALGPGRVLITGGTDGSDELASAEVFDDATGTFTPTTTPMSSPRSNHTATPLPDGRVLIAGGVRLLKERALDSVELYDPATSTFSPLGTRVGVIDGAAVTETTLGKVLVTGGTGPDEPSDLVDGSNEVSPAAALKAARTKHRAVLLLDGAVMVTGGLSGTTELSSIEIVSADAKVSESTGNMARPRVAHAATRLSDGRVLVTGGFSEGAPTDSFEVLTAKGDSVASGTMIGPRARHTSALLADGRVLIVGGVGHGGDAIAAEVFDPGTMKTTGAGEAAVGADTSIAHVSGGVLFASGATKSVRFEAATTSFVDVQIDAQTHLVTVSPALALGCKSACRLLASSSLTSADAGLIGLDAADRATTLGPDALVAVGQRGGVRFRAIARTNRSAAAPALEAPAEAKLKMGQTVTLRGQGLSAALAKAGSATVALKPLDNAGPPIALEVKKWAEGEVTVLVPHTVYTGPAWAHVIVDGVAGRAALVSVTPGENGQRCENGAECSSGHCVDEVCCEAACVDGCRACSAARKGRGVDGVCEAIAEGGSPRHGCDNPSKHTCGPVLRCDGAGNCAQPGLETTCDEVPGGRCQGGVCAEPPPPTCAEATNELVSVDGTRKSCAPGRCRGGSCVSSCTARVDCADGAECVEGGCVGATCDERGEVRVSIDGQREPCAPFACRAGQCLSRCDGDGDCVSGAACRGGTCADSCTGDGASISRVTRAGAETVACAPYRCEAGACLTSCQGTRDCAPGSRCDVDGRCVAQREVAEAVDPGCAAGGQTRSSAWPWVALALLRVARARRRKPCDRGAHR